MELKPHRNFYMALPLSTTEGEVELPDADGAFSSDKFTKVEEFCKDDCSKYGITNIIYVCVPIKKITYEGVKSEDIKAEE